MGYMTDFDLNIKKFKTYETLTDEEFNEIKQWLVDPKNNTIFKTIPNDVNWLLFDMFTAKWYSYNDDMRRLSKAFPQYTFELTGYGELPEDEWRHYYFNGKDEVAELVKHFSPPTIW